MDTTFVNKIIVAFNELISELGEDSVGVCGLKNDGRMTILFDHSFGCDIPKSIGSIRNHERWYYIFTI